MMQTANVFIDKVRVTGPCAYTPDKADLFFKIDMETGEVAPISAAARQHSFFSHGGEIHVKFMQLRDRVATRMRLDFCPPKLFQGHNVFGHGSLKTYVTDAVALVAGKLGIEFSSEHAEAWRRGDVDLTEIHLTANFATEAHNVRPIIAAIAASAGPGARWDSETSISIGFTPKRRSKYNVLTIYHKAAQLEAEYGKNVPEWLGRLKRQFEGSVRAELKLYSQALKRRDLSRAGAWNEEKVRDVFFDGLAAYNLHRAIQPELTQDEEKCLKPREVRAYRAWMSGIPLSDQFASRATVKAYVDSIRKKVGVDVGGRCCMAKLPKISLRDVFSPDNTVLVPEWTIGTKFYSPPKVTPAPRRFARGISQAPILESEDVS